ncbi:MAG: alpha/beta hydrolase [Deltaproteobacteria bacterium]|nr:alpha/beta hydrolase [Deltaproteobacteria bacterium]
MEPTPFKVPGADGLTLAACEWSVQGVPLVFVHGYGNDLHVWDEICPTFAPHYRTLAITLRGHGDSDHDPEARYDHGSMARDLEAALDSLGCERAVIVGHSMGGRVAMRFAGDHPERMAGFAIVDSAPELDARGVTRIRLEAKSGPVTFESVEQYAQLLTEHYPVTNPATLRALASHWLREEPDGRFSMKLDTKLRSGGRDADPDEMRQAMAEEAKRLWSALESLPCPALVVRGAASDVFDPDTADRMVDDVLPNGRLAVVPRSGHSVMLDNPAGFIEVLSDFVLG